MPLYPTIDIGQRGVGAVQFMEPLIRLGSDDAGNSGLSHAGGSIENQVRDIPAFDDAPQARVFT